MGIDFTDGQALIDAATDADELRRTLKAHASRRHKIDFTGGI